MAAPAATPASEPVISPVKLAFAITHDAPSTERLTAGLAHIADLRKNPSAFAIEPNAAAHLTISEAALKKETEILAAFPDVRLLDPAALKLLISQDLASNRPPRLAPFQLNDKDTNCAVSVAYRGNFQQVEEGKKAKKIVASDPRVEVSTNFHSSEMERVYEDFFQSLAERAFHAAANEAKKTLAQQNQSWPAEGKSTASAVATLGEILIPSDAKAIIAKAQSSKLFDRIYLLAEASSWEIKTSASAEVHLPRNLDPLIVAEANGKLWVIGAFDLTAAEKHVWDEFCIKPWDRDSERRAGGA